MSVRRDSLPSVWPLSPHTAAKHDLLRGYLEAWFPILGRWNGRVLFLDGFAGPGIYSEGEPGSPMIALETLLGHRAFKRLHCEFAFLFLERDSARFESLQTQIERLRSELDGFPRNVVVEAQNSEFEHAAEEILAKLAEQKKRLAPTFAFIDPFGFSGLPIDVIRRLLTFERCELFLNFMIESVNRFVNVASVNDHMVSLFGTDEFANAKGLSGQERLNFLLDLYQRQARELCGFDYVRSFEMIHDGGHTGNCLVYGTRSITGLKAMKAAMWKVDPTKGIQFSDREFGQENLFTGDHVDLGPLRDQLLDHFRGQVVAVEQIEEYVLVSTHFAASHYNRGVLNPLEKEGLISVVTSSRKRAGAFPPRNRHQIRRLVARIPRLE